MDVISAKSNLIQRRRLSHRILCLLILCISTLQSCVLQSEKTVCEQELDRAGVGCEGFVAFSVVFADAQNLTPEQEGARNAALLLCVAYLAEKAKCDGKSTTKPDILF
mgnify:CR=1 FL=1